MITIRNDEFELIEFIIYYGSEGAYCDSEFIILVNDKIFSEFYIINDKIYLDSKLKNIQTEEEFFRVIVNLILENINNEIELKIQNLDIKDISIKTHPFEKDKLIKVFSEKLDEIKDIYLKLNRLDCKFQTTCDKESLDDLCKILKEKLTFDEIRSKIRISGYELFYKLYNLYNSNKIKLFKSTFNRKNLKEILKVIDQKYKTPYIKNVLLKYLFEDLSFISLLDILRKEIEIYLGPIIANNLIDDIKKIVLGGV